MKNLKQNGNNILSDLDVTDSNIIFKQRNQKLFEIKSNLLTNCTWINNEISLEISPQNETLDSFHLLEIRLMIPNDFSEQIINKIETKLAPLLNDFHKNTELICIMPNLPLAVPRGKYNCSFYKQYMKFHGSSYNYEVFYKDINKSILLPLPDKEHINFILGLKNPVRQGKTQYFYIMCQFQIRSEIEVEMKLKLKDLKNLNEKLELQMAGKFFEIFSNIFKSVSGINIIIPSDFVTTMSENSLKCSYGSQNGLLFFLCRSLVFIPKPIINIQFDDIARVEFQRMNNSDLNKHFDMHILTKGGQAYLFSGINKSETNTTTDFLISVGIMITISKEENFGDDPNYEVDKVTKKKNEDFINDDEECEEISSEDSEYIDLKEAKQIN